MLVKGFRLNLREQVELPRTVTQLMIDFEVFLIGLGLQMTMRCIPCAQAKHEKMFCEGGSQEIGTGGRMKFWIECGCRERIYDGDGIAIPRPPTPPNPRAPLLAEKREHFLTHDDIAMFTNIETVLKRLQLQYELRCLACRLNDRSQGIVWGSQEVTATEWKAECVCTKRVYRGSDAGVPRH